MKDLEEWGNLNEVEFVPLCEDPLVTSLLILLTLLHKNIYSLEKKNINVTDEQWCGTIMVCCGSGSYIGIVLVPVPATPLTDA